MEPFLEYVALSTICLSLLYLGYVTLLKNKLKPEFLRYYLVISMLLATTVPLSNFKILIGLPARTYETEESILPHSDPVITSQPVTLSTSKDEPLSRNANNRGIEKILIYCYFLGLSVFVIRLFLQLIFILRLYNSSTKASQKNITILLNKKVKSPFSFFKWVFISKEISEDKSYFSIITHERVHVSQYHSFDMLMIELLSAVMWFNPVVWLMRKSIQLVHEYLADEGVLSTGIDKLKYQALLINLIAEERLICLSSGFNHSLIKKRMIMMTKSKFNQRSKLRILILIPLATILFLGVACINGSKKPNVITAVEPVRMNVFYLGVDNPLKVATSGYDAEDLTVTVDNGSISGQNGEYIVHPKETGLAHVSVAYKDNEIQKTTFRVKQIPCPIATVDGKKEGWVTKSELANWDELIAQVEDFDFDASFSITGFSVSYVDNAYLCDVVSQSNKFTDKQRNSISKLAPGSNILINNIKAKGPDGKIRNLSSLTFTIKE